MRIEDFRKVLGCLLLKLRMGTVVWAQIAGLAAAMAVLLLAVPMTGRAQDDAEQLNAVQTKPVLRRHVMLPSTVPSDPGEPRYHLARRVTSQVKSEAVNTGTGIVYTCDSNVPASTCTYLNTTVAGYYNSVFTNANANIYIEFGDTGLGESDGYINLVHYTPYVTALTNNTGKSTIQTSALSAIKTYADPVYSSQDVMEVTVAIGSAMGFTGLAGINSAETAPCTAYATGCYNEVITLADAAQQAAGGFSFYYDNEGGSETADQYDFYGVVMHETDEVLGTASCISTDSTTLEDACDNADPGSSGIPSAVDLDRFDSPGKLAEDTSPSTTDGQYFSYNGGVDYGAYGYAGTPKVYNTLSNGDDFADYLSSTPNCGTNIAVQDAVGCPGEDQGLTILDDGQSEIGILNAVGFNIPEPSMTSPAPGSTLSGSSATFTWKVATGASAYVLYVGSTGVGSDNIFANTSAITTTSQAVTGLPTSGTIYVRLWTGVGGATTWVDYTYTGGTAATKTVSVSPTSLSFGSETEGSTSAAQAVTVKNTGTGTVTLSSETITGTDASSFVKSATTCGSTLAAAASCTVSVEFKPAATGTLTASLSIADNATGTPQTVALSGTGAAANTVSVTPTSLAFPDTVTGATSDAQVVTVKNTGTVAATISSIALGGTDPTSFQEIGSCGTSLAVGASCSIYVAMDPKSAAALTATLSVTDSATGSPQKVTLSGTGTAAPSVKLSVTSLSFPATAPGATSEAQAVTLTNSGPATLTLTSITLGGTNPTDFEELNTCGATLAASASCTVYVAFKPAAAAAYTGTLIVTDNGASSPQSVKLSGTGS
jgi:hypothetical protein